MVRRLAGLGMVNWNRLLGDVRSAACTVLRRWLLLILILVLALPSWGSKEDGGDDRIVLGPGAAFLVTTPTGWIFDNEVYRRDGIPAVLLPAGGGKSWYDNDATVIYNFVYDRTRNDGLADFYTEPSSKPPRPGDPKVTRQDLPAISTSDGREARVQDVRGGPSLTRVAYIETPQVVSRIVLSAPDQASFDRAVPAFEGVVKSFRLLAADSGDYLASSGVNRILGMTAETHDEFGAPEGWKKELVQPGVTIYQRVDGKAYGIIAVYAAKPSVGDPLADYEASWRELAQTAFRAGTAPTPKYSVHHHGWQVRIGETGVESGGQSSTLVLAVYSGFGKYTSVLITYNDHSFRPEVDEFIVDYVYPAGWLSGGPWTFRDQRSHQYVNGALVDLGAGGGATRNYTFEKDTYRLEVVIDIDSDHSFLLKETGTYSVSGNKLTLHGRGGTQRELRGGGREVSSRALPIWDRTYTFKLLQTAAGAPHGPGLVLWGVEENDLDGGYSGFIPNAFVYVLGYH